LEEFFKGSLLVFVKLHRLNWGCLAFKDLLAKNRSPFDFFFNLFYLRWSINSFET